MKKVAIVAGGASRIHTPFDDKSFDKWGFGDWHCVLPYKTFSAWFEIHKYEVIKDLKCREDNNLHYLDGLRRLNMPIYTQQHFEDIPKSIPYPIHEITEEYFMNSIPYLIFLAIKQGYEVIRLYGVDMKYLALKDMDIAFCISHWMGYAKGLGIDIWIHEDSIIHQKKFLYGWRD